MRRGRWFLLGVLLTLGLGIGRGHAADNSPILIGYLASVTGFCSQWSQEKVAGARLAVEAVNARGGVLNRPVKLIVRDDQATPDVAVRQARDLVLSEQVRLLAGTCSSAVGLAVRKAVADASKVLYIAPVADPAVFEDAADSYVFGTVPTTTIEGRVVAEFLMKNPKWKRISFIGEDYSYSRKVFSSFEGHIKNSEKELISSQFGTVSDYTPFINKIMSEKPDFVFSNLIVNDLVSFTVQAGPLGFFKQAENNFIGFFDLGSLVSLGDRAPIGVYGYTYYPEPYLYPGPTIDEVAAQYRASTGSVPTGAVGDGYNEISTIVQGIELAKSVEPDKIAAALSGATVQFVQGPVKFRTCDHLPVVPVAIGKVAGPTEALPFPHLEEVQFVDTSAMYPPC